MPFWLWPRPELPPRLFSVQLLQALPPLSPLLLRLFLLPGPAPFVPSWQALRCVASLLPIPRPAFLRRLSPDVPLCALCILGRGYSRCGNMAMAMAMAMACSIAIKNCIASDSFGNSSHARPGGLCTTHGVSSVTGPVLFAIHLDWKKLCATGRDLHANQSNLTLLMGCSSWFSSVPPLSDAVQLFN